MLLQVLLVRDLCLARLRKRIYDAAWQLAEYDSQLKRIELRELVQLTNRLPAEQCERCCWPTSRSSVAKRSPRHSPFRLEP